MARALGSVINVLDPDVIVLGGGLSNIARLYGRCRGCGRRTSFPISVETRLVPREARRLERRARRGVAVGGGAAVGARDSGLAVRTVIEWPDF